MALSEFNLDKHGGTKIWISRRFADPLLTATLADVDRLFDLAGCEIIKDQKKIKVGRLALAIAGAQRSLYVKRYNSFSLRFRLLSPFLRSGALRSLIGAEVLQAGRIATAKPVAAVENRFCGMLRSSFFISEEIAGGKTADAYWLESLKEGKSQSAFRHRRTLLHQLGDLFSSLHAQQIYHNDLKDSNIVVVDNDGEESLECYLLDLEGVRRCARLSERRRIKNLTQLYRTLGNHVSRSRQAFFLKCYLGRSFTERKFKRRVIDAVVKRAKSVDRVKREIKS